MLESPFSKLLRSTAPGAVILIRLLVGSVFVSEGIQKFLFSADLGVGRFTKLGIMFPSISAPFVGTVEILCGTLLLLGLLTRLATIPLLVTMAVAITSTKGHLLLTEGFWKFAHEARTDYSMIMCLAFLLAAGAGPISLDELILKRGNKNVES